MAENARNTDSARTAAVSVNTRELDSAEGRDRWAVTLHDFYGEMDVAWPHGPQRFRGVMTGRPFGDLHVNTVRAEPHTVVRTPAMIESDGNADYLLCLVIEGRAELTQDGRAARLEPGSFAVLDCAAPFVYHCPGPFRQVVVRSPRALLTARLPERTLREAVLRPLSARSGAGMLVASVLGGIAALDDDLAPGSALAFSSSALDMLVTALAEPIALNATAVAHREDLRRVKHAMEARLHDPEHTVAEIAAELGMSVRYVQKLFATTGTTPRGWLYQVRLERARKYLLCTDLTVAEISEQVGFRDTSHFGRTFRARFGASPGRYRITGPDAPEGPRGI